jgi:hypothetical protein
MKNGRGRLKKQQQGCNLQVSKKQQQGLGTPGSHEATTTRRDDLECSMQLEPGTEERLAAQPHGGAGSPVAEQGRRRLGCGAGSRMLDGSTTA